MVEQSTVAAFGAAHVIALTGLSQFQLREWDKAGFFPPEYAYENRRVAHGRVYSFRDLVGLRTLSVLSKQHRIGLPELKRVAAALNEWSDTPWSSLTLYVLNKEVHFHNPATGKVEGALSGQIAAPIPLENVMDDMRREADKLRERPAETVGSFEQHRYRLRNAVLVAGTRIPVSAIYNYMDAGYSAEQIIKEYPDLTPADIDAAMSQRSQLTQAA